MATVEFTATVPSDWDNWTAQRHLNEADRCWREEGR
jgi:hypothetical protein